MSVHPVGRPVMLVILDGFGWREEVADNAVRLARTPTFTELWATSPHAFLQASGRDVGLPAGQMGNSEVGHLNIGAGRVIKQELVRIGDAVEDGSIASLPAFTKLTAALKKTGGTCHLIGLVSPGGVHSHQEHGSALAKYLHDAGIPTVVHAITDGRDTPPQSAGDDLTRLQAALPAGVPVATVIGPIAGRRASRPRARRTAACMSPASPIAVTSRSVASTSVNTSWPVAVMRLA